jgi:hypothetical protein
MGTFYVRPAAVFARFVQAGKEKLSMRHRMALLETPALHAATIWENQRHFICGEASFRPYYSLGVFTRWRWRSLLKSSAQLSDGGSFFWAVS